MLENYKDIMTIADLQKALRIGKSKSYELIREREIESFRVGNTIRIPKKSVVDYILQRCYNGIAVDGCAEPILEVVQCTG